MHATRIFSETVLDFLFLLYIVDKDAETAKLFYDPQFQFTSNSQVFHKYVSTLGEGGREKMGQWLLNVCV